MIPPTREHSGSKLSLFLVDGIGPFFRGVERHRINWSKVPFDRFDGEALYDDERWGQIQSDFDLLCRSVCEVGYNAVTLDDVAHLHLDPDYPADLARRIEAYRARYRALFACAQGHGLGVYLTSDVMFFNPTLEQKLGGSVRRITGYLAAAMDQLLTDFPAVQGVILRIGESDAPDVKGEFLSKLVLNHPRSARRLIQGLLPVFENHDRHLIFRTWSVGAYHIGDLMWNRDTFEQTFSGLDSPHLIISIKHGESDFFRFLPVNRQFFKTKHAKIVEFQARREYEGAGQFPSFVGWDTEAIRDQLAGVDGLVGISVWVQTGGWTVFRRLTYLEPEGLWNEINAYVILRLFRDDATTDGALRQFYVERYGAGRWDRFIELMECSDRVIKNLFYVDEFAARTMFFRRLRVPALLSVYWDHIFINHSVRKVFRCFVMNGEEKLRQADEALGDIDRMKDLADDLGLPVEDFVFQRRTFEILAAARAYYFLPYDAVRAHHVVELKEAYRKDFLIRYAVKIDFTPLPIARSRFKWVFGVLLRDRRRYRLLDRLFTLRLLAVVYTVVKVVRPGAIPAFARERAMGLDAIFK